MAILFSCECGKQLRVPDTLSGKRIKCPGCQSVVAVPASADGAAEADEAVSAAPPRPRTAAPPDEMVHFTCACGKKMQARKKFAGERLKCAACGATLTVPAEDEDAAEETEAITAKPRAAHKPAPVPKKQQDEEEPDRDMDDEDEDKPPPPRKRQREQPKRNIWPWVAIAAGLLIAAGGVTAWLLWPKSEEGGGPKGGDKGRRQEQAAAGDLGLVPRDALGFLSVRVADIWNSPQGKKAQQQLGKIGLLAQLSPLEQAAGMTVADLERVTVVFPTPNPQESWMIVAASKPYDQQKIVKVVLPQAQEKSTQGKQYYVSGTNALCFPSAQVAVAGRPAAVEKFLQRASQANTSGPLGDALQTANSKKSPFIAAVAPPAPLLQALKQNPAPRGFEAQWQQAMSLTEMQLLTLTAEFKQGLQLDLDIKFPDDAKAKSALEATKSLLTFAQGMLPVVRLGLAKGPQAAQINQSLDKLEKLLKTLPVEQRGPVVHLSLQLPENLIDQGAAMALLLPAQPKVRQSAGRSQSANNLHQLALAMHNYNTTHNQLPTAAIFSKDGKPLLSWRVAILPFIEQEALYKRFKLDEAWDGPNNIKLLPLMPATFAPPASVKTKEPHSTFYQVFVGPNTPFNGNVPARIPNTFKDGTSSTMLIVEAAEAVPWTKPEDIPFDGQNAPRLGGISPTGFNAAMADAAVVWVDRTVSPATIKAAITPAGGEVLGPDWPKATKQGGR